MADDTESRDIFSFKHKDFIKRAVIETLSKSGVCESLECFREQQQTQFWEKKKKRNYNSRTFGLSLEDERQDRVVTEVSGRPCYLPKFFVTAVEYLKERACNEGLFRKAGSVSRQKKLKTLIETGSSLSATSDPHDVASLFKQYLRELPQPLLTHKLTPVLLECIKVFRDESIPTSSTNAILLSCLLLPTHHLLCLQVLMSLLSLVTTHYEQSLMDSASLSVVIAPNILPVENKLGGKKKKNETDLSYDIKNMTFITQILIDHANLIGQVPADVQKLSEEIREREERFLYSKKSRNHQRRGSVSGLLRGTFNKLMKTQKKENNDNLSSPDTLGPSACKKPALDSSLGTSSDSSPPVFLSTGKSKLKTRVFRAKQHSSLSSKGKKKLERVPLLCNQQIQYTAQEQHDTNFSSPLTENIPPPPPPPTPSTSDNKLTDDQLLSTEGSGSTYRLVSRTIKLYPQEPVTGCGNRLNSDRVACKLFRETNTKKLDTNNGSSSNAEPRRRKKSLGLAATCGNQSISTSQSDFAISRKFSHITSSTPVSKRPQIKVRRRTDSLMFTQDDNTVENNHSYLHAVKNSTESSCEDMEIDNLSQTPKFNNPFQMKDPFQDGSVTRLSMNKKASTPLTQMILPSKVQSSAQSGKLSRRAKQYVVNDQPSVINNNINTARSPWINRRGIQVSEWIL